MQSPVPPPYTPIPTKFITEVMPKLAGAAVQVYLALCFAAATTGTTKVSISNTTLAGQLALSTRMIQKAVRQLVAAGCVRRHMKPGPFLNVLEIVFLTAAIRRPPQNIREWIALLGQEDFNSPLITEKLITQVRAAAGGDNRELLDVLRRLYHARRSYDLKEFPIGLISDVAQEHSFPASLPA